MPTIDPALGRIPVTIQGHDYTMPVAFAAGHTLTADEAAFCSRQAATYLANPIGTLIGKAAKDNKPVNFDNSANPANDVQTEIDSRFTAWTIAPSNRGAGGSEPTSPLDRMIKFLAGEKLKALIVAKGLSVRKFQTEKDETGTTAWEKNLTAMITRDKEKLTAQAQSMLDELNADSESLLGGEDTTPSTTTTTEATTPE